MVRTIDTSTFLMIPILLLSLLNLCIIIPSCQAVHLTIMQKSKVSWDPSALRRMIQPWSDATGHNVTILQGPVESNDVYNRILNDYLKTGSPDLDIVPIDVVWPGDFAEYLLDLNDYGARSIAVNHLQATIKNTMVNQRLVSLPWTFNPSVMYYRSDLLQKYGFKAPPQTWDELENMAKVIQAGERAAGNEQFWGYAFQGRSYEGTTCDGVEWIASHGGGNVIENDRTVSINNPAALKALTRAARFVGSISPLNVVDFNEAASYDMWFKGNTAFLRAWPYAIPLANAATNAQGPPLTGKFGVIPIPRDDEFKGKNQNILGGWNYAVSKHSRYPSAAADLVFWLCNEQSQLLRFQLQGDFPTLTSLQKHPTICNKSQSNHVTLCDMNIQDSMVAYRFSAASSPNYGAASKIFYSHVNQILSKTVTPEDGILKMQCQLHQLVKPGTQPPNECGNERTASSSIRALSYAIASISLVVIVSMAIATIYYRQHVVIKRASPVFCQGIYAGCAIITCAIYADLTDIHIYQNISCWGTAALTAIGFSLIFGNLFAKYSRIASIMINSKRLRTVTIKDIDVALRVGFVVGGEIIALMIWYGLHRSSGESTIEKLYDTSVTAEDQPYVQHCRFSQIGMIIMFAYNAILVLWGIFLAWQTRSFKFLSFNESKHITACIWVVALLSIIVVPLLTSLVINPSATLMIRTLSTLLFTSTILAVLFGPKLHLILTSDESSLDARNAREQAAAQNMSSLSSPTATVNNNNNTKQRAMSKNGLPRKGSMETSPSTLPNSINAHATASLTQYQLQQTIINQLQADMMKLKKINQAYQEKYGVLVGINDTSPPQTEREMETSTANVHIEMTDQPRASISNINAQMIPPAAGAGAAAAFPLRGSSVSVLSTSGSGSVISPNAASMSSRPKAINHV